MTNLLWPLKIYQSIPTNWRGQLGSSLDPDGTFHFWTPGVLRGRSEIGFYTYGLGVERAQKFREFVEQHKVWELSPLTMVAPDQPTVQIIAGDWDGPKRSGMWSIDALPPEVISVMDAFNHLVEEACAGPVRVLAGSARWSAPRFSAREELKLELTLQNKGSDPISFQSPIVPTDDTPPLHLLVSQLPGADGRAPKPQRIAITRHMLSRPGQSQLPGDGQRAERLELAPGQSVRFAVTTSAYLSPAEHRAVLFFDTGGGSAPPRSHVRGVLTVELPPLHIVHR